MANERVFYYSIYPATATFTSPVMNGVIIAHTVDEVMSFLKQNTNMQGYNIHVNGNLAFEDWARDLRLEERFKRPVVNLVPMKEEPDPSAITASYENLASLLRDNGYVVYKKKLAAPKPVAID